MKAKTKFLKMYYKLPKIGRARLVYLDGNQMMSLELIAYEIHKETFVGEQFLFKLGFEDD